MQGRVITSLSVAVIRTVCSRWALIAAFTIFISSSTRCLVVAQQTPQPVDSQWNIRFDLFQLLIQQSNLEIETNVQSAFESPTESSILMFGRVDRLITEYRSELRQFVESGGRLIIAADIMYPSSGFGSVNPGPVTSSDPDLQFQGFADCLRLNVAGTQNSMTDNLSEIVTNRAGWIEPISPNPRLVWESIISLPANCQPFAAQSKPILALARPTTHAEGIVIVLSDPSILSNGMIWYSDNSKVALGIAKQITAPNRKRFVIAVDSRLQSEVLLPNQSPDDLQNSINMPDEVQVPAPNMETVLQVANAAIKELAAPESINNAIRNQPRDMSMTRYTRNVWIFLASILTAYLAWKLLQHIPMFRTFSDNRRMKTAAELQKSACPNEIQNNHASEILAREFSRIWAGHDSDSEWRICLEQLKEPSNQSIPKKDRVSIESLLAIAIFGGRATLTDQELQRISETMQYLIRRYRPNHLLPSTTR